MSNQIDTATKIQYDTTFELLAQQMMARLDGKVRMESKSGERNAFDQLGLVAMRKKETQHSDTPRVDVPHRKRWVDTDTYEASDLLDWNDLLEVMNNPGSDYTKSFLAAAARERDKAVITAALGTAYTGKNGTTGVALGGGQQIAAGSAGMTLAKVKQALKLLKKAEAYADGDEAYVAWTSEQEEDFLEEPEVVSIDYNTQRVLVRGGMGEDEFYGFKYVRLEDWTDELGNTHRILPKASTTRSCVAWVKSGLLLNDAQKPFNRQDQRPDKSYSWQYYVGAKFGATRMQETKVVQIDVVEA